MVQDEQKIGSKRMLNPNEIDPRHLPSMQAAILKNRSALDEQKVAFLYRGARLHFMEPVAKATDKRVHATRSINQAGMVTATCTDPETGIFVQFTGDPGNGIEAALLVFGKKYCQEYRDAMRQNVATKIW